MSEQAHTSLVKEADTHQQLTQAEPAQVGRYMSWQEYARLEAIIERAERVVEEEIRAINAHEAFDLEEAAYRKSKVMLELERVGETVALDDLPSALVDRLQNLRERVALNLKLLSTQLETVRDLSSKLTDAIREIDSDGTYDASAGGW